ncbi:hypothetical protein GCM10027203_45000 [Nonomuraea fastidiosa]
MSPRPPATLATALTLAGCAVTVVALAGCSAMGPSPAESVTSGTPAPDGGAAPTAGAGAAPMTDGGAAATVGGGAVPTAGGGTAATAGQGAASGETGTATPGPAGSGRPPAGAEPVAPGQPSGGAVMFGPAPSAPSTDGPVPDGTPARPSATPATTASPLPTPKPGSIDQRDADAVGTAVLTTMWTVDTTVDRDQRDAALRAAGWLSPEYLAELRDGPQPGTDAAWTTWAAHRARTRPTLTEGSDTRPPDTATHADRQWQLTVTPIGADGWRGRPLVMTAFVSLQRRGSGAPWRVTSVTLR